MNKKRVIICVVLLIALCVCVWLLTRRTETFADKEQKLAAIPADADGAYLEKLGYPNLDEVFSRRDAGTYRTLFGAAAPEFGDFRYGYTEKSGGPVIYLVGINQTTTDLVKVIQYNVSAQNAIIGTYNRLADEVTADDGTTELWLRSDDSRNEDILFLRYRD